ncbi:protein trichome birefringence-like 3 isoform X1 [Papaver somniferum]|uniref:protein trichome birefringence-like 3 isoform X1 n=1 Tax=Papaver somniferum TaxID=3469 RepID=UPI000E7055D2|nr:protein trichome birefringence-like 3 isoform X1 [Papaver somniferum]
MMNSARAKTSVYTIITVFFVFAFIVLLLRTDENTGSLFCISILKLDKSWLSQESKTGHEDIIANDISTYTRTGTSVLAPDESSNNTGIDNEEEFIVSTCDIAKGKWVFNNMSKPLYSDHSCPYLDKEVSCVKNGRTDSDYRHWEWQPDDCVLPRFDPEVVLDKLRGKRLMFVGDSLQRNQWQSFVCLVQSVIPPEQKTMRRRGRSHTVFKAKEYNATVEFYWAPFLIESNSDLDIISDPRKRILKVDSVSKHAQYWVGVDILIFNTYIWWMNGIKIKSLWGSFSNGEDGYEELEAEVAYRIALKTWANWVDSTIASNKTRVFFTTMSPTHMGSIDRHEKRGFRCYNETKPFNKYWGRDLNRRVMNIVASVVGRMKIPVQFINITQMSERRIDGHASVYTEFGGKVVTDEQKAKPRGHTDCIHWCLPGVPDTWNQLFFSYL